MHNPDEVMGKVEEAYSEGKVTKLDGITIEFDDFWFNLRKSHTGQTIPMIRLNLEAKSEAKMKKERDNINLP